MAHRVLALNLVSAHNLRDVNLFSRMAVYGTVSVYGDPWTRQRTQTDHDGARHPTWDPDDTLCFTVPPTAAAAGGVYLHVLLRTERLFSFGGADVGEVFVPLADLLAIAGPCPTGGATAPQCTSYQVRKVQCAERRGTLILSYRFGPVMMPLLMYPPACTRMPPVPNPGAGYGAAAVSAGTKNIQKKRMFAFGLGIGLLDGGFREMLEDAGHGTAAADAGGVAI